MMPEADAKLPAAVQSAFMTLLQSIAKDGWKAASCAILPILAAPAAAQTPWPAECNLTLAATLPFEYEHGHIVVDAMVNDTPRRFLVDTGGFATAVTEDMASDLKLDEHAINQRVRIEDAAGAQVRHYVKLDSLTLDHLRARNVRVLVQKTGEGIIGPDVLAKFDVEIDFDAKMVRLFRPHPCSGRGLYWPGAYFVVPIYLTRQDHIRLDVTVDGKPMHALLDTGAPITTLDGTRARTLFEIRPEGEPRNMHGGAGGEFTVTPARFHSLGLGGFAVQDPLLYLSDGEDFSEDMDVTLGLQQLRHFHLYIAYQERKLYVSQAGGKAPAP